MKLVEWEPDFWAFEDTSVIPEMHRIFDVAVVAWEEGEIDRALFAYRDILATYPHHIDSLYHCALVYDALGETVLVHAFTLAAVGVGLHVLPDRFSWTTSKLEWGVLENRPFLRAYHYLGLQHLDRNETEAAALVFTRLLAVSPNDNLGVRYLLPLCWLSLGDIEAVIAHCRAYDDQAPEITYTYPLALAISGDEEAALQALRRATKELPLVGKELRKRRHPRPKSAMSGYITHGGADQAYEYWKRYGAHWAGSAVALRLLAECYT